MFIWLFRLFCLSWILAVCDFHGIGPFLLLCLIKEYKIVHGISLLSFYWLQESVVILFKEVNFAKVKFTDLRNTFWWVLINIYTHLGFPGGSDGKASACLQSGRPGFDPWVGKIPWRRKWHPTPVLLPGKSHGWRTLVGYSPWGRRVGHDWATSLSLSYTHRGLPRWN